MRSRTPANVLKPHGPSMYTLSMSILHTGQRFKIEAQSLESFKIKDGKTISKK